MSSCINPVPFRILVTVASPEPLRDSDPSRLKKMQPTSKKRPGDPQAGVITGQLASEKLNSQPRAIFLPRSSSRTPGRDAYGHGGGVSWTHSVSALFPPWPRHCASLQCLSHPQHHSAPAWRTLHWRWEDLQQQEQYCPQRRNPLCGRRYAGLPLQTGAEAIVEPQNLWSPMPGTCILVGGQSEITAHG